MMKKSRKNKEGELYVQIIKKPEKICSNAGEVMMYLWIYCGWYFLMLQFCRQSLRDALLGSAGAVLLGLGILVNGQKEKRNIRQILHAILLAAVLLFLLSFVLRKGWIFQGALIAGNGLLETIGRNTRTFETGYAIVVKEAWQPFCMALFFLFSGVVLAAFLELFRICRSRIGTIVVSLLPVVIFLVWHRQIVDFPILLIYGGILCLCTFWKKEKSLAQFQIVCMMIVFFAAATVAGSAAFQNVGNGSGNLLSGKVRQITDQIRYGKKTTDSLPEGKFAEIGDLKLTDEAALKVTMEHPDSVYLRGFVGSVYTEEGWQEQNTDTVYDEKDRFYWLHQEGFSGLTQLSGVYQLEHPNTDNTGMMAVTTIGASRKYAYVPYELSVLPDTLENVRSFGDDRVIRKGWKPEKTLSFTVHSNLVKSYPQIASEYYHKQNDAAFAEYKKCENSYNAYVYKNDLQIPDTLKQVLKKVLSLDLEQTESASADGSSSHISYEEANTRITGYLNENITYTENIMSEKNDSDESRQGADGKTGDFVTDFLMTEKKGYSVHYASAAVLMYRALGIPARYVEGYLITPEMAANAQDDGTIYVTGKEAHAWVEIYQDGIGWIPMEVTPPYLDKMERPDFETVTWQGGQNHGTSDQSGNTEAIQDDEETKPETQKGRKKISLQKAVLVLGILLLLVVTVWLLYQFLQYRKKTEEKRRVMYSADAQQAIRSCYAELMRWLSCDGIQMTGGSRYRICKQLKEKYGKEMADSYRKVTRLAEKAAYSSHPMEESQAEEVRAFLRDIKKQILDGKNLLQKWKIQGSVMKKTGQHG